MVIPALNEEASLPLVLADIPRELVQRIVVVDNGSRDRTAEVAAAHGALIVAEAERGSLSHAPEDADELRLVASFLRRPPPELRVGPLEAPTLCALVRGLPLAT